MSRILAIQLENEHASLAVVSASGERPLVEAYQSVTFSSADPMVQGRELAEGIDSLSAKRHTTIAVLPRTDLLWQTFQLPPAPEEDLAALVALQAERDQPLAAEEEGFDFLPLAGSEEHPHRVLGVSVSAARLKNLKTLFDTAGVQCQRLLPRPFGWHALAKQESESDASSCITAALEAESAAIISEQDQRITRLRSIPMPTNAAPTDFASTLTGELRRTALSMTQGGASPPQIAVWYDGTREDAATLQAALPDEFVTADIAALVDLSDDLPPGTSAASLAPLAGLAAETATGRKPLIDLLHPRKPPVAANQTRTFVLAGLAAAAMAALLGWKAYRDVQTPLEAAEVAQSQLEANKQLLEDFAKAEKQHATIAAWQNESVDILDELDHASQQLRPLPLDAENFPRDADVFAKSLSFDGDVLTLTAFARDSSAVQPLEQRLRNESHRVTREKLQRSSEAKNDYAYDVVELIDPEVVSEENSP